MLLRTGLSFKLRKKREDYVPQGEEADHVNGLRPLLCDPPVVYHSVETIDWTLER